MSSPEDQLDSLFLQIIIKPNSQENRIVKEEEIIVYVKAVPVKGKANKELVRILSKEFKVSKSQISILAGQKSRKKLIKIIDLSHQQKNRILNYINQ